MKQPPTMDGGNKWESTHAEPFQAIEDDPNPLNIPTQMLETSTQAIESDWDWVEREWDCCE